MFKIIVCLQWHYHLTLTLQYKVELVTECAKLNNYIVFFFLLVSSDRHCFDDSMFLKASVLEKGQIFDEGIEMLKMKVRSLLRWLFQSVR